MGWRQSAFNEIPICARGTNPRRTISKNGLALLVRKFLKAPFFLAASDLSHISGWSQVTFCKFTDASVIEAACLIKYGHGGVVE